MWPKQTKITISNDQFPSCDVNLLASKFNLRKQKSRRGLIARKMEETNQLLSHMLSNNNQTMMKNETSLVKTMTELS